MLAGWLAGSLDRRPGSCPGLTLQTALQMGREGELALLSELPAPSGRPGWKAGQLVCAREDPGCLGPLVRGTERSLQPSELSVHQAPLPSVQTGTLPSRDILRKSPFFPWQKRKAFSPEGKVGQQRDCSWAHCGRRANC